MKKLIKNDRGFSHIIIVVLLMIVIGAIGTVAWTTAKKNASTPPATTNKAATSDSKKQSETATTPSQTACTSKSPSATTIDNIEASITSGNTAALEGYMATSVNVIIAASEGLGAKTSAEAVTSITSFITLDTTSWDYDFTLSASTLSSYNKGSYSQYFPSNAVVGKASSKKVISFSFDCNAKISTVFLAANEALLL